MTTALAKNVTRMKPKVSVVTVTPKDAARWLEANGKNRSVRPRLVDAYARDMENGNWQLTGEAVKFAVDGSLLDGQHRLAAVVASGCSVDMLVVRGLTHEAQEVMDSGAKRLAADALHLRGYKQTALLASMARMGLIIEIGGYGSLGHNSQTYTTTEIADFVAEHPALAEFARIAAPIANQMDCAPTVVGYAMWRLHGIDSEAASEFFDKASTKVGLDASDPVLSMVRRFAEARRHREHLSHQASLSIIFRTWNASREGRSLHRIPVASRDGVVAVPEPK